MAAGMAAREDGPREVLELISALVDLDALAVELLLNHLRRR